MDPIDFVGKNQLHSLLAACNRRGDLEKVDYIGNTALLKACYLGAYEDFEILIKHKAHILAMNCYGQNALTLATFSGSWRIIAVLLKLEKYSNFTMACTVPPLCVAALTKQKGLYDYFCKFENPLGSKTIHDIKATDLLRLTCK